MIVPLLRRALRILKTDHGVYKSNMMNFYRNKQSRPSFLMKQQREYFSDSISAAEYDRVSNSTLEFLLEDLEQLEIQRKIPPGFDVEFSNGVLTLKLGVHGTYVINRQPPNRQIWLSSPVSGPKRFDYDTTTGKWTYSRDGSVLQDLLREELTDIVGSDVTIR